MHIYNIARPKPPTWQADLTPGGYVKLLVSDEHVPNAFNRFMQYLCFGVRWHRIK